MKWHHSLDQQPENNKVIVQLDMPHDGVYPGETIKHYCMGMRKYKASDYAGCPLQSFWWCYAQDFPFPK